MVKRPLIDDKLYMLFGRIVSNYARAEVGVRSVLGMMLQLPLDVTLIIAAPYTTQHLRNVAKSVAKIVLHEEAELLGDFVRFLGAHKSLDRLRNDISHNMWARGTDDAIRPMQTDVREGKARFLGLRDADRQYSREDFRIAANLAVQLNHDLISFLDGPALAAFIESQIPLASLDIEEILGISTKPSSSPP